MARVKTWHDGAAAGRLTLLLATFLALSPPPNADANSLPAPSGPDATTFDFTIEEPADDRFLIRATLGLPTALATFPLTVSGATHDIDHIQADTFQYVFHRPTVTVDGKLQLSFFRLLPPGNYTVALAIANANGSQLDAITQRCVVHSTQSNVVPDTQPTRSATTAQPALNGKRAATHHLVLEARQSGLLVGPTPIEARLEGGTKGDAVHRVRFWLDGMLAAESDALPHRARLDLGPTPRSHTVRAAAYDAAGRRIAAGEVRLNTEPHRFAVRLARPGDTSGPTSARARVEAPADTPLAHFTLFVDEEPLVQLFAPPFLHPLPPTAAHGSFLRAIATLQDGRSAEDLVQLRAGGNREALDVQLVELYATVRDRAGHLVPRLAGEDFEILEDGVQQMIHRFEAVSGLPLELAVLMDTSRSMVADLEAATAGARRFFETVLRDEDRAAVFTFNHESHLAVPFTHRTETLAAGLDNLDATGETRLYDTLTEALRYFAGLNGRGALLLFSDGEDVCGRHVFKQVIDYARHTGVVIYPIIIDAAGTHTLIKHRMTTLARETGGMAFFLPSATRLDAVYASIEADLRAQYLLAYHSTNPQRDGRFRTVELKAKRRGLEARTRRGYYP